MNPEKHSVATVMAVLVVLSLLGVFPSQVLKVADRSCGDRDPLDEVSSLPTRDHRDSLTSFRDGTSEKDVIFLENGINNTVKISLPSNCRITSARMDIEGIKLNEPVKSNETFADTVANSAWWGDSPLLAQGPPSDHTDNVFGAQDHGKVRANDDDLFHTQSGELKYAYHHFSLARADWDFDTLQVEWKGAGYTNFPHGGQGRGGGSLYLYNHHASNWELVETYSVGGFWAIKVLGKTYIANLGNYFDVNEKLDLLATVPTVANGSNTEIMTDFVEVEYRGNISSFISDPTLNVDDVGENEWEYQGEFREKVTIDDIHSLKDRVQERVDAHQGDGEVEIVLSLTSSSPGILRLSNLLIEYDLIIPNQPPDLLDAIPENEYSFREDSDEGVGLIDLHEFFDDDGGVDGLNYTVLLNHEAITASVNTTTHCLDFRSSENFFGRRDFQVKATDGDGLETDSNTFFVNVLPTNDPPHLVSFDGETVIHDDDQWIGISALEDDITVFPFEARDIDGDVADFDMTVGPESGISYLLSPSMENSSRGTLTVEPANDDVGYIDFTFTINDLNDTDGAPLMSEYNISLRVINTNDDPEMSEIGELEVYQDEWLNLTLHATDPDTAHDAEEMSFFAANLSEAGIDDTCWDLDEMSGNFSFHPDNSLVGTYKVNFSVRDNYDGLHWEHVVLNVKNRNDPPSAGVIEWDVVDADPTTGEKENLTVTFKAAGSDDPDLIHGDVLVHRWDFDGDGVYDGEGTEVTWTFSQGGNHTVLLSVFDSGVPMQFNSTMVVVEIRAPPNPSGDDDDPGDDDGKEDEDGTGGGGSGDRDSGSMGTVVIVIICIVALLLIAGVVVFLLLRRKGGKKEGSGGASTPTQEAQPMELPYINHTTTGYQRLPDETAVTPMPLSSQANQRDVQTALLYPPVEQTVAGGMDYSIPPNPPGEGQ